MTGNRCIVYKATHAKDPGVSFHRSTANATVRAKWISKLQLEADLVTPHSRVCSRHFPGGNATKEPQLTLGSVSPLQERNTIHQRSGVESLSNWGGQGRVCKRQPMLLIK